MKAKNMLFLATALFVTLANKAVGQKKDLTIEDLKHWQHVAYPAISPDGKYASYAVLEQPVSGQTLYIKAISGSWQKSFINASGLMFTDNSKRALFQKGDTLHALKLGTGDDQLTPAVKRFQVFRFNGKGYTLVHTKDNALQLIPDQGKSINITNIQNYQLSKNNNAVLLKKENSLVLFGIADHKETTIHQGETGQMIMDDNAGSVAFTEASGSGTQYYLYRNGKLLTLQDKDIHNPDSMLFVGLSHFSIDGKRLFVKLKEKPLPIPSPDAVMVDVWGWKDQKLQSEQLNDRQNPQTYTGMLNIATGSVKRLEYDGEVLQNFGPMSTVTDTNCIIVFDNWKKQLIRNIITGKDTPLPARCFPSPDGNYLYYTDSLKLMAYEVATGKTHKFFDIVPDSKKLDYPFEEFMISIAWPNNTTAVFYDKFDLWALDITGKTPLKNLTNGYGRTHNLLFRPLDKGAFDNGLKFPLIVGAFDQQTKDNGFYIIDKLGRDPRKLSSGPYAYGLTGYYRFKDFRQVKALKANAWLVNRESLNESDNYFITRDFKVFSPVSDYHPEMQYPALQNELINFTTLDGKASQALLYKPENFDSNKKYPLIITYYEKLSQQKNLHQVPELPITTINIPWELQKGYLILQVDIYYTVGTPSQSAFNAIEGAVDEMAKRPYIDTSKMGIIGHSFGGMANNYIITHSHRYKCAITSSGVSNLTSSYLQLKFDGSDRMDFTENAQIRMGNSLWQSKENYIAESPVLKADNITTPLLMMANKKDGAVNFSQGMEMFLALRRLGKKVWLLQYDNGAHILTSDDDSVDRLIRFDQFFDHYLQDKPAPKWMTEGIPAKYKGLRTGYELDVKNKP